MLAALISVLRQSTVQDSKEPTRLSHRSSQERRLATPGFDVYSKPSSSSQCLPRVATRARDISVHTRIEQCQGMFTTTTLVAIRPHIESYSSRADEMQ